MWQEDLVREIKKAKPGERKAVITRYTALTGFTAVHLYRTAKMHGFLSCRKIRADKGICALTGEQSELVAALIYETRRENKGPIMPTERAIQIAEDNGIIDEGQVSPAAMNRILRERQISKQHMKNPEPHTNMRSLHPNHTHVFDVSVCIQYYLKNGGMGVMDERVFYKNKPHNFEKVKTRLMRYVVVDHFSGGFYFRYYDAAGESADNLFRFLKEAWANKDNGKLPFRGVPFVLLMDSGSANSAQAIVAMLERMDVRVPKGLPYNPRRQGAVETLHRIIEDWFESGLRIQPAFDVETLNTWAFDWMIRFQAVKEHTRHHTPRTQMWLTIKPEELRELPPEDILQDLYARPEEECLVYGDYAIRFRGKIFNVRHVEGAHPRLKVKALLKPFKWPGKVDVIHNGKVFEANEIKFLPAQSGGFRADAAVIGQGYRDQPETRATQAGKRFDNIAYGEERKKGAVPFAGLNVFGYHAEKVEGLEFLPKEGTPFHVERTVAPMRISIVEFFKELKGTIGAVPPEMNAELRAKYGETIGRKEAEEVMRRLKEGGRTETETNAAAS